MTLQTLLLILIWSFVAVCFIALIFIVYFIGRRSIKDNPDKALVFVKNGNHVSKPFTANLSEKGRSGHSFLYKNKVVMIPASYGEVFHNNKRMLFINNLGQIVTSPFAGDTPLSDDERDGLIYELCAGHVGADGMRALKGVKSMNVIIIAIVAFFVGALLVFGITQYQTNMGQNTPQQQQQQQQQRPIEVK